MRVGSFTGLVFGGFVMASLAASSAVAFGRNNAPLFALHTHDPRVFSVAMNPVCEELQKEMTAAETATDKLDALLPTPPATHWEPNSPQAKALCDGFREISNHSGKVLTLSKTAIDVCKGTEMETSPEDYDRAKAMVGAMDKNITASCGGK